MEGFFVVSTSPPNPLSVRHGEGGQYVVGALPLSTLRGEGAGG